MCRTRLLCPAHQALHLSLLFTYALSPRLHLNRIVFFSFVVFVFFRGKRFLSFFLPHGGAEKRDRKYNWLLPGMQGIKQKRATKEKSMALCLLFVTFVLFCGWRFLSFFLPRGGVKKRDRDKTDYYQGCRGWRGWNRFFKPPLDSSGWARIYVIGKMPVTVCFRSSSHKAGPHV